MGVPLGLSIDASAATNADFFNVMRALMWSDWQRTRRAAAASSRAGSSSSPPSRAPSCSA